MHAVFDATVADRLLACVIRGERSAWPWDGVQKASEQLLARARFHGAEALVYSQARSCGWPEEIVRQLRTVALEQTKWELRHQQVVTELVTALERAGIQAILLKGSCLAYWLYSDPALRSRSDSDLIVAPNCRLRAEATLAALGFRKTVAVSGKYVSYQSDWCRSIAGGGVHTIDLHWRISNSELLSGLYTFEELRMRAVPLPALGSAALGTSLVDSLLIACMHRAAHRQNPYYVDGQPMYDANRMVWLYDIHLLASRFTAAEWDMCHSLAATKGLGTICLEALERTRELFGTSIPPAVEERFLSERPGPAAMYLASGAVRRHWMDFRALGTWRNRAGFLREHLLPTGDYMRSRFSDQHARSLTYLYMRRFVLGVARLISRSRTL